MFRVGIIDDHILFTEALGTMLGAQDGIGSLVTINQPLQTLELIEKHNLNTVLVDINMPGINGLDLVKSIKKVHGNSVKVIIVSTYNDLISLRMALSAGADGYCTKNTPTSELMKAMETVFEGKQYISDEMKKALTLEGNIMILDKSAMISEREKEVLQLLQQGLSTRDIAARLFISEHTVASHRKNLLSKLEANSTIEMINNALKRGLL